MRLPQEVQDRIVQLRRTTTLNLKAIANQVGTSRGSVQRVCERSGLGNVGLRNKTKQGKRKPPRTTCPSCSSEELGLKKAFRAYRKGAENRSLPFELSRDQFRTLVKGPCYYCDREPRIRPKMIRRRSLPGFVMNGVDRKDNDLGYTLENCVSCCTPCNVAKGCQSLKAFEAWIRRLYSHLPNWAGIFSELDNEQTSSVVVSGDEVPAEKWLVTQRCSTVV